MQRYVYPAVFYKDGEMYRVIFPDIQLETDGKIIEEAFLYAKEFLKSYFVYVNKYDLDFNYPSDYETVSAKCKDGDILMLVDAEVTDKDVKGK